MNYSAEYKNKLCTAAEAVQAVKSGDWVDYSSNNGYPASLDKALAARKDELFDVKVRGNLLPGPIAVVECDAQGDHFCYNTWHCSSYERKLCDKGRAFFTPMLFRNLAWYYREFLTVNVAMLSVAPMDSEGYFSLSCALGVGRAIIDKAEIVIIEVNEALPRICGGEDAKVHISEVDYIVEAGYRPIWEMGSPAPSPEDMLIARHIFPHIKNGATVQLGIGATPTALGKLIAESELKDLGMHTELCSDGYLSMFKAGKLTNLRKSLHPGKGVLGLAIGSRELYDWLDNNPHILGRSLSYVNDPSVIAKMDNMVSINSCLNADLYGQIGSESSGTRQISGTGGQLDFVTGATAAPGGKAFLCMSSTYTDKTGQLHSRIIPHFNGDIITTPRSQAYYIVTENGAVNLAGLSTWQRAEALISIAHESFRDELIRAAEEQRIWRKSNKR